MTRSRLFVGFAFAVLVGCGNVVSKQPGGGVAPPACDDPTSVDSCGDACALCGVTSDRELATCDGTACGIACREDACSDGSCARLAWSFDDGTLGGITPRLPSDLSMSVRSLAGNPALAIDVTDLTEVSFVVPVCLSGTADYSALTLTANVLFDGGTLTGQQWYVTMSVVDPSASGGFLDQVGIDANTTTALSEPLSKASLSGTTTTLTFQAGSFGGQFTGTIWFDDIQIQ